MHLYISLFFRFFQKIPLFSVGFMALLSRIRSQLKTNFIRCQGLREKRENTAQHSRILCNIKTVFSFCQMLLNNFFIKKDILTSVKWCDTAIKPHKNSKSRKYGYKSSGQQLRIINIILSYFRIWLNIAIYWCRQDSFYVYKANKCTNSVKSPTIENRLACTWAYIFIFTWLFYRG